MQDTGIAGCRGGCVVRPPRFAGVFVRADGLSRGRYVCLKEVRLEAAPFLASSWQVLHRDVAVAGNEVIVWRLMRSAGR